jgi:hypothetical protein
MWNIFIIIIIIIIILHILSYICRYKLYTEKERLNHDLENILTDLISLPKHKRFEKVDEICLKMIEIKE